MGMSGCSIASEPASVWRVIMLQAVRNLYPKRRIRPWLARVRRFGCARICMPLRRVSTVTSSHQRFANVPRLWGCHESIRNASTPDSMFRQSAQTLEQSAQASAPSTIASGTPFVLQDSTVRRSFQCNIFPKIFCTCFFGRALRNQYEQR